MNKKPLPDNLSSRIVRCYIEDKEFKSDDNRQIKYSRLCIEFSVNDMPHVIRAKIDDKDKILISLADSYNPEQSRL